MFIVMLSCSLVLVKAQDMKMVVDSLKKIYAPDSRTSVWNVECIETYKAWKLKGEVDNDNKKATILESAAVAFSLRAIPIATPTAKRIGRLSKMIEPALLSSENRM